MTDGAFPDRLSQLKARWESDPSSRIFLQLAEEYRHQGRIQEALAVLDRGLREHPGYLSALVAKGRCHIELGEGEAARSVLERVVKQDPTQMVANKLLVRAHLETGDPARARERLDLYSLLNDSDPEIGDLRRQIKLMDRPKEPMPAPVNPVPDDIFDLGRPTARRAVEDVFSFDEIAPPPPAAAVPNEPEELEEDIAGDGDLFPGLLSRAAARQRYLSSLASEGIFEVGEMPLAAVPPTAIQEPPRVSEPEPAVEDASWLEEISPPAELWPEELELEPEPVSAASQPVATATLGELYLRQGHLDEAERIFRGVLEREPDNGAARAGLGRIEEARIPPPEAASQLDAGGLLAGFQPAGAGTTARKIFLLNRYLDRLRGGRNVS